MLNFSFKNSEEISVCSQSIHQTTEKLSKFKIGNFILLFLDNFTKRLSDYDKGGFQNKTERMQYLDAKMNSTSNLF